jgi:hypothetical protein
MLARLLAILVICNLPSLGQQAPGLERPVEVEDEGVFLISAGGKPVGSESFKIHSSAGKIEARGEVRLHVEQNGRAVNVQSFSNLVLDPLLRPLTYTWSQHGPQSSRLEVDFRARPAKVLYKTIVGAEDDRAFDLPPDVMVLDDNVFHHFQLIAARFQATGGGKQTLRIFVPQEALPSLLTVQDMGNAAESDGPALANLQHLVITTDVTHIDLWVNQQSHLERISVPTAQLEAVRKR